MLALRAILAAAALPGTITLLLPWLAAQSGFARFEPGALRSLGIAAVALGATGLLWCIVDFARIGRGTLAPIDPPRFVVRGGLYRLTRNPMYVCVVAILLGESLVYGSGAVLLLAVAIAALFHLFVTGYEEPTLRQQFGDEYAQYLRDVPRWIGF